jgi:dihydroorotase
MAYDLLIKGGQVIDPPGSRVSDPAQGIQGRRDVGIEQGKIAAVAPDVPPAEAREVIDATGLLVTPGLIDLHTHVADAIIPLATAPDEVGVRSGVTTVCDAGSAGYANMRGFAQWVIPQAQTDVFCFLHLSPVGEVLLPEIGWEHVNPARMAEAIQAHRDLVKGVKLRATVNLIEKLGIEALKTAKRVAADAGLPVVVHLGIDAGETIADAALDVFTREMLSLLDQGDVLTHAFTKKGGRRPARRGRNVRAARSHDKGGGVGRGFGPRPPRFSNRAGRHRAGLAADYIEHRFHGRSVARACAVQLAGADVRVSGAGPELEPGGRDDHRQPGPSAA